jgi:hypothetical protein
VIRVEAVSAGNLAEVVVRLEEALARGEAVSLEARVHRRGSR